MIPIDNLLILNNNIKTFLDKTLSNQKLLKLLYYKEDPLNQSDLEDTKIVLDDNIDTTIKISDIEDTTKSYLIHYMDNFRYSDSGYFMNGDLVFDIIVHKSLKFINDTRDERWIFIGNELNNMLHRQNIESVGKVIFSRFYKVGMGDNDYTCYRFVYSITHFNT